jgi:hypothetical protein
MGGLTIRTAAQDDMVVFFKPARRDGVTTTPDEDNLEANVLGWSTAEETPLLLLAGLSFVNELTIIMGVLWGRHGLRESWLLRCLLGISVLEGFTNENLGRFSFDGRAVGGSSTSDSPIFIQQYSLGTMIKLEQGHKTLALKTIMNWYNGRIGVSSSINLEEE